MGIVKEITGAVLPYAILAGGLYVGYRVLKKPVGDFIEDTTKKVDEITSRTPQEWGGKIWEATPIKKAMEGDWGGAAVSAISPVGFIWNVLN